MSIGFKPADWRDYTKCFPGPEYTRIHKVNNSVKNKDTVVVVLPFLLLTLNTFHFLLRCFIVDFDQLIAGWACCLLF